MNVSDKILLLNNLQHPETDWEHWGSARDHCATNMTSLTAGPNPAAGAPLHKHCHLFLYNGGRVSPLPQNLAGWKLQEVKKVLKQLRLATSTGCSQESAEVHQAEIANEWARTKFNSGGPWDQRGLTRKSHYNLDRASGWKIPLCRYEPIHSQSSAIVTPFSRSSWGM